MIICVIANTITLLCALATDTSRTLFLLPYKVDNDTYSNPNQYYSYNNVFHQFTSSAYSDFIFLFVLLIKVIIIATKAKTAISPPIAAPLLSDDGAVSKMLMAMGIDEETATQDACRIEHVISDKTFEVMKQHADKYIAKQT